MGGEESEEYWKVYEVKYNMLEKMEAWEVVDIDSTMNTIPRTWTLRKKRRIDGTVSKFKSRSCVRGDKQIY